MVRPAEERPADGGRAARQRKQLGQLSIKQVANTSKPGQAWHTDCSAHVQVSASRAQSKQAWAPSQFGLAAMQLAWIQVAHSTFTTKPWHEASHWPLRHAPLSQKPRGFVAEHAPTQAPSRHSVSPRQYTPGAQGGSQAPRSQPWPAVQRPRGRVALQASTAASARRSPLT